LEAHEAHEKIEEAAHGHRNKRVAILIAVLAALLAITDMGGKSAQNTYTASNIEASNLWAFFQAKTVRTTMVRTAAEALAVAAPAGLPPDRAQAVAAQIAQWKASAERYDSEPSTGEGRQQLAARAKASEAERDHALAAYHLFEYGASAFQLAIVLASASLVTGVALLAFVATGLGGVGTLLALLGGLAPTLLHV
jgi:hypothetical protein